MPKQSIISVFSVFAALLILVSANLMMERDKANMAKAVEVSLDFNDSEEQQSNSNIQEEIKEEAKLLSDSNFDLKSFSKVWDNSAKYTKKLPEKPFIKKPTPPPNFI